MGCTHAEVRYLSREMWGFIQKGFPLVKSAKQMLINDPRFKPLPREIDLLERAVLDEGKGADFEKIPQGFEPIIL